MLVLALAAAAPASPREVQAIPLDVSVAVPPAAVKAEGGQRLLYELRLANFGRQELELKRIEVLSEPGGAVVQGYEGDGLAAILARPGTPGLSDRRRIGPGLTAVAFIEVATKAGAQPSRGLRHRLTFSLLKRANAATARSVVEGGEVSVDSRPPIVLGPPLRGGGWLASHGLSNDSSHRRTLITIDGRMRISQRYAIDWTRIGPDGQAFRGDPADNANWTPYGADVLAVADGRVVALRDGIPENDPTASARAVDITYETVGGNHLILDVGRGRFVFYAHLRPGSFRVRLGDQVRRGQVLANLGNSGQSDAPHLHMQVTDAPSPLAAEGQPFVFDSFRLQGHLPSLKVLVDGTGWHPSEPESVRERELPVENAVVRFPD
jgi:hypothetical protein